MAAAARYLKIAREIAESHHEQWNGGGYPQGLVGCEIPLAARIVALADVYDALVSKRVYKDSYTHQTARAIIIEGKGKHFDPAIVDAFLAIEFQFVEVEKLFSNYRGRVTLFCNPGSITRHAPPGH